MNHMLLCFSSLAVWLHQTRIGLSLYDVAGQGYLRESVSNLILETQEKSHYSRYLPTSKAVLVSPKDFLSAGFGELHSRVNSHTPPTRWPGEILLLVLCLHCRPQILLLP